MNRRQVTLEDGRYLIFYTFDDEPQPPAPDAAERPEPDAKPIALEEQSV